MFSAAIFLPITVAWVVLIAGLVVWVTSGITELFLSGTHSVAGKESDDTEGDDDNSSVSSHHGAKPGLIAKLKQLSIVRVFLTAPFSLPLFLLALAVFLSGAVKGGPSEAVSSLMTMRTFIVYFWALSVFQRYEAARKNALCTLIVAGAIAGLTGAIQQLFDINFTKYDYLQATGFVSDPMAYAGQMEISASLCLAFLLSMRFRFLQNWLQRPIVFIPLALLNLSGVVFGAERSAWVGFTTAAMVMAGCLRWRILVAMIVLVPVLLVGLWATVPVVQQRVNDTIFKGHMDKGISARLEVWRIAQNTFLAHPICGVGIRSFPRIHIPGTTPKDKPFDHAHNNFLHIATTTGIVGLAAYAWLCLQMLVVSFRAFIRSKKVDPSIDETRDEKSVAKGMQRLEPAVYLGVLGGVVSLMVAGLFEYNFGTGNVRLFQWFVLALLPSYIKLGPSARAKLPGSEQTHADDRHSH